METEVVRNRPLEGQDREALGILLGRKAHLLTDWEVDFLDGLKLRQTLTPGQDETFDRIWGEVMTGTRYG